MTTKTTYTPEDKKMQAEIQQIQEVTQVVYDEALHMVDHARPYGKPVAIELPKMSDKEFDEIIHRVIQTYGKEAQIQMLFEEMAELQNAICKLSRGRGTVGDVCEEIADVMIMCFQMAQIFGAQAVEQMAQYKMRRLKNRLNNVGEVKA